MSTEPVPAAERPLIIDAAALAVWRCTASSDARPLLCHIAIRDGKALAANGHLAAVADLPNAEQTEVSEALPARPEELINRRFARYLSGRLRRGSGLLARVAWRSARGLTWIDRDMVMAAEQDSDSQLGAFPDMTNIIGKEYERPELVRFYTAPDLTRAAIETISDFLDDNSEDGAAITWRISDPHQAIALEAWRKDGRLITVLLMPMHKGAGYARPQS